MSSCMQIFKTSLQCIVALQLWGKAKKSRKTLKKICHIVFFFFLWPSLRDWRTTIYCNVVLTIFHAWWNIFCVWKNFGTVFCCLVVFQLRGDCPRTFIIFMIPGSENATKVCFALNKTRFFLVFSFWLYFPTAELLLLLLLLMLLVVLLLLLPLLSLTLQLQQCL